MINYIQKLTRCIFLILFIALKINAQSLPSVDQITSMSPSQQKALASQYGIDLSSIGVPGVSSSTTPIIPAGLEDLGTEVETEKVIDLETAKKLLQDRDKRHLLRKLERESIPVFERDNLDLKELKTYGHNFFDGEVSNFFAVDNAPIPNNYVIGTGDNIRESNALKISILASSLCCAFQINCVCRIIIYISYLYNISIF